MTTRPLKRYCDGPPQYGLNIAASEYTDDGVRLIRTSDILADGTLSDPTGAVFVPDGFIEPRHRLRQGDVLFSRSGTLGRCIRVTAETEGMTFAGFLVRFRLTEACDPRFLEYCAASKTFQVAVNADAVTSTISNFNAEKYGEIRIPDLPLTAQRAITAHLDLATGRIDGLIAKKQRMIELLDERLLQFRRLVFADADGWRLKHLLRAPMAYGVLVPEFVEPESGVRMLRIGNLGNEGDVVEDGITWIPESLSRQYRRTQVEVGDVVLSVVGSMGRAAVITADTAGANLNRALARLQLRGDLDPWVVWHWTQTSDFLDQARLATGGGTAQPTLNLGDLAEFKVGLPGDVTQWPAIAARLRDALEQHTALCRKLRSQIALLREHRQALITAAVTGELDIPGAAA